MSETTTDTAAARAREKWHREWRKRADLARSLVPADRVPLGPSPEADYDIPLMEARR